MKKNISDLVREYAVREYIEPARRRNDLRVEIIAGELERAVQLSNRTPLVCQALRSRKFLDDNNLVLEKWEGPPSGISTTVKFIYRLKNGGGESVDSAAAAFLQLRGIAKDVFESLGGGESFIRSERAAWGREDEM